MFELIYRNRIIGLVPIAVVGETYYGYVCWEVDYANKVAYLTD